MGSSLSLEENESLITHPRFRSSQVSLENNVIKANMIVHDERELEDWIQSLEKIKNFNHDFLFNAKSYAITRKALCGTSFILKVTYDNYPYLLIDQINNRAKLKRQFEENQIWYLMLSLVSASNDFLDAESSLGDVRPHNIFFNEKGYIKIAHRFSWPCQQSNIEKTKFQNIPTFLSPEEVDILSVGKIFSTKDTKSSQSFSIGLTLLSTMLVEDLSSLYNVDEYTINLQQLQAKCRKVSTLTYYSEDQQKDLNYSKDLIHIIQRFCAPKPQDRILSHEVFTMLEPFSKQIILFEQFQMKKAIPSISLLAVAPQSEQVNIKKSTKKIQDKKIQDKKVSSSKRISVHFNYSPNQSPSFRKDDQSAKPIFTPVNMMEIKQKQSNSKKLPITFAENPSKNSDEQLFSKIQNQLQKSKALFPS